MKKKPAQELYTVRLMMLIICILIPMNVITIVLSILSVQGLVSRMRQNTQGTLEVYASQIDSNLKSAAVRSRYISTENQYFIYLDGQSSKKETNTDEQWHAVIKLFSEYQDYARENPIIGGLCAVFPGSGVQVIKDNRYSFSSDKESMQAYLDERIREERNLTRWECQKVGAHTRLFYLSKYRGSYSGAWFDLDDMTRQIGIMDSEEMTLFTDAEGQVVLANAGFEDIVGTLTDPEHPALGSGYDAVSARSAESGIYILRGISTQRVLRAFPNLIRVMLVLSLIAMMALPVILFYMNRWIIRPVRKLNDAMEEISRGNMEYRIEEESSGSEFERMNREFNRMMEEVSSLKINVYEEQLEKQDIRLKFLSQQIQPHFILNTLNILYSYEQDEYALSQKMILCLSRYFRYIVNASQDAVPLRAEMEHIRNYFEIQQARYPDTFFAFVECDESIASCLVPPLLIQNFAENAIKHSLKIGNQIDIFVIAQPLGEDRIRIRVLDTGQGIAPEIVEKINEFRRTGMRQEGLGIGIQNAIERLSVLYGADTTFEIDRDEPHGTRIEIVLPLRRGEDPEEDE
ncbi:MAG: histidine kinase [Lachnospiraceae bacterium]|nr:histidine kinase [Lachnospiraceae bacterium]